ncbi:MAG TPA: hypothetical protein VMU22_08450 [Rhizomicrobium sp.]|nr:hypothetical protein [Rhizomicrobium sp.]
MGLPPAERAKRFRELAATALRRAATSRSRELKTEYAAVAAAWQALAVQTEHAAGVTASAKKTPERD